MYLWRVVESAYFGTAASAAAGNALGGRAEAPSWMLAVLWSVVLANVYFGLQPEIPFELASHAAASLLPERRPGPPGIPPES